MSTTSIEWTNVTWNPVRGCSIVSEGCRNCYAMRQAHRQSGKGKAYEGLTRMTPTGPKWTGDVRLVREKLDEPLHWRTPRLVFVNSMSDLFHEAVPLAFIAEVFEVMASSTLHCDRKHAHDPDLCWWGEPHTYQILTKRPENMRRMLESLPQYIAEYWSGDTALAVSMEIGFWPLPNVWLGVSCENQAAADERIPVLLDTPAAIRWVSAEPLLGPLDLELLLSPVCRCDKPHELNAENARTCDTASIDWLIVGGESGPGARPCHVDWIRSIITQCRRADVPVFLKQLGAVPAGSWRPDNGPGVSLERGIFDDRKGGDIEEWPEDLRIREYPTPHTRVGA